MASFDGSMDDDTVEDDELSPELSAQLGELLLGAAQQFNVGLNFLQPLVFGGDEDFGFNPGDEEMMDLFDDDSDTDSWFDDTEGSDQIFKNLADSHVIDRLSYHTDQQQLFKLPRVTRETDIYYEEVYRLLEELELLCKAWRRRVDHPFTAHIESPHTTGDWVREGEGYSSSEYEYDTDEEDYLKTKPSNQSINESQTKKKFCQSAKIFYQLFASKSQQDSFLRFVSKTKKFVFRIIFSLFLEALPEDVRFKMPDELWEKIWKHSQNSYFKYKAAVPITVDNLYYKAGFKSSPNTGLRSVEVERVKSVFGAFGNLHMLMFEILFKSPGLLQPSAGLELEVGSLSDHYSLGVWRQCVQQARTSLLRLQQLDSYFSDDCKNSVRSEETQLSSQVQQGALYIHDLQMNLQDPLLKIAPAAALIVSESICPYVCLPSEYMMENGRTGLMLLIIDVLESCRIVHKIKTPIRNELFLIEVGSHRVMRNHESGWKKNFCLTADRLSFVFKFTEKKQEIAKVYTTQLGGESCEIVLTEARVESVMNNISEEVNQVSRSPASVFISHSSTSLLLLHQSPYSVFTRLSVHSLDSGETLISSPFHDNISLLSSASTRVLLRSQKKSILLFSVESGEIVHHWSEVDLNKTLDIGQDTKWSALFDSCSHKPQICLFTNTLSGYSQVVFNPDNEMERPKTAFVGSFPEAVTGLGPYNRLMNGCLITNTSLEVSGVSGATLKTHQVSCYCLQRKVKHNLLTMGQGGDQAESSTLNMVSRRWSDPSPGMLWNPERRPVFAVTRTKLCVMLEQENRIRVLDLSLTPKQIIDKEAGVKKGEVENGSDVTEHEEVMAD